MGNETQARVGIDDLLKKQGWRLDDSGGKRNVLLEEPVTLPGAGDNRGFIDYLLLDADDLPLCVLEAKRESVHPLSAKEQARQYAQAEQCPFAILSNGVFHYFWDIRRGEPETITTLPTQKSLQQRKGYAPDGKKLADEDIPATFLKGQTLRDYQIEAIQAVQKAAAGGKTRFLLEMATGTGKTTIAAALCKLFLKTGNARRILFLVDRIELENQAERNFQRLFENIYLVKKNKTGGHHAHIVVSTVQSLLANNKYRADFSPTDFDLVISDEAHRSLGGKARKVFEYFLGYKLGLTATPKDYLRGADGEKLPKSNPKEWERRNMRDTYKTFGCEGNEPTFRYGLDRGVKEKYLIKPLVLDARTEITAQLLSEQGYAVKTEPKEEENEDEAKTAIYKAKDYEVIFCNDNTNRVICESIIKHGLPDPLTGELGKTLVFCVRQDHAARITAILNQCARKEGYTGSDFAVQVTSSVPDAQKFARDFANNNLNGHSRKDREKRPDYETSKTRICVTVGMMTTGYDCPDILNVALLRPIFSPSEFVQMKGRGTRKYEFKCADTGDKTEKTTFMLFDFFANYEYFEYNYNYDRQLKLPVETGGGENGGGETNPADPPVAPAITDTTPDKIKTEIFHEIGDEGMKVDRRLPPHEQFEQIVRNSETIKKIHEEQDLAGVLEYLKANFFPRIAEYMTVDGIRRSYEKAYSTGRKIPLDEMLMKALELIGGFKKRGERVDEEFQNFCDIEKPDSGVATTEQANLLKDFFEIYLSDKKFRAAIDAENYGDLFDYPAFSIENLQEISGLIKQTKEYIQEHLQAELAEFDWDSAA